MKIKDIAKLAEVSPSTVSKIINKKDEYISASTRERVLKIVREYNYQPNSFKSSKTKKSWIIGILLNSTVTNDSTLDGLLKEAQANGYSTLLLNNYNDPQQELKNIKMMCQTQIDGIIWEPVEKKSLFYKTLLEKLNIPIQTIGVNGEDETLLLPYEKTSYQLTKTLLNKNHKHIACLTSDRRRMPMFIDGYKKALFDNHLNFNNELVFHEINDDLVHSILNQEITAILISHYFEAIELYTLISKSKIQVPNNLSIAAIKNDDDLSLLSNTQIKISSINIKNADFGKFVCEKIIHKIEGKKFEINHIFEDLKIDSFASISGPYNLNAPKAIIVGSINIDTYLNTPKFLDKNKVTILSDVTIRAGGKGLNQAVGVAKLGQPVTLIGKVGIDRDSDKVFKTLDNQGINTNDLIRSKNARTGRSYILVQEDGESMISIHPGANGELTPEDLLEKKERFNNAAFCLIQTEIPLNTIESACNLAKNVGAKVILKPSIEQKIPKRILKKIDILIPNETSLFYISEKKKSLEEASTWLLEAGVKNVIVTLGEKGSFLKTDKLEKYFPAADFPVVDTTGACDAFISALTSYLMEGYDIEKSIKIANIAAGFSLSRYNVINSLIDKHTLDSHLVHLGLISSVTS